MKQIISLGMGVQSTAIYLMSSMGELPRADHAIFSDTGKEGAATYQYLDFLLGWQKENDGIPIAVCRDRNLHEDLLNAERPGRFTSIPAFTKNDDGSVGMLRRQCTAEYKITVVDNYIRDHIYGLSKGSRRPKTQIWHGITLDEIGRMSQPYEAWKINTYPFLGQMTFKTEATERLSWARPMTRSDVVQWYILQGLPIPPKSSCVFCPYQSDKAWALKKKHSPEDFRDAVRIDEAIRNSTAKGIHNPVYLHRSCRPLATIAFDVIKEEEWGECSGNCHV
ncbi:hypothetical protein [Pedobacter sp.]